MTHSGGKPHAVGDRGQRYEVSYFDPDANCRKKFGWAATTEGAQAMAHSIELHPSMQFPQILDRWAEQESNWLAREGDEPDEECEAGVLHWDAQKPRTDTCCDMRAEDWENACHELLWEKGDPDLFLAIQRRAIDLFAERVKPREPTPHAPSNNPDDLI